jgi:ribulose-phosphate 3-epimerase
MIKLAPSILSANFANLLEDIKKVEEANVDLLHIDVMDGHFVPNLSFGPNILEGIRSKSKMIFDTHLMIEKPSYFAESFIKAGADIITMHIETGDDIDNVYNICKSNKKGFGLAISPDTPLENLNRYLKIIDILLVMGIQPGFGGQKFIPKVLERIKKMAAIKKTSNFHYLISVDGGVSEENAVDIALAGADILVAGSAIFGKADRGEAVKSLLYGKLIK